MRAPSLAGALLLAAGAVELAWAQNLQDGAVQQAIDGNPNDGQVPSLTYVSLGSVMTACVVLTSLAGAKRTISTSAPSRAPRMSSPTESRSEVALAAVR